MKTKAREPCGVHRHSTGIYTGRLAPLRFKSEPATRKLNLDEAPVRLTVHLQSPERTAPRPTF